MDISYESVRRWFLKFGAPIARNLGHTRPIPNGYWHLDEMVIVIRGQRYWLWRAVDNEGEVLSLLLVLVLGSWFLVSFIHSSGRSYYL